MHTPHDTLNEHYHGKILVRVVELQVSQGDANGEGGGHYCNPTCTSK
jgi:hypothetical protein